MSNTISVDIASIFGPVYWGKDIVRHHDFVIDSIDYFLRIRHNHLASPL